MDRAIPKKTWTSKRILAIAGAVLFIVLLSGSYYYSRGGSRLNVDATRLTISTVTEGGFQEFIPINGIIMPLTTIYLDALEGGRVEEKYVEDGAVLKKGDAILRLSNTDLELSLVNQETQVFNLLTQMQISRNAAQKNTIDQLNRMADVEKEWKEAERLHKLNKTLYSQKAISEQEFKQSQIGYEYQIKRKKLTEQVLRKDSISTNQELEQARQSYERTQAALKLMRKKVSGLIVRAPIDGQLTSLDAEVGQSKNQGNRLGQIDVLSGFKVRADIDEHYLSRVYTGLGGDFTIDDKSYKLKVIKVFTQVTNGRFQVDLKFDGTVPTGIRRGQTLQVRLSLSNSAQALLLPRGGFYQQTGGNWIFKLSEDGKKAYKVNIQLGRQNPDYYEVLEGLNVGDKVVTSGYEGFGDSEELVVR